LEPGKDADSQWFPGAIIPEKWWEYLREDSLVYSVVFLGGPANTFAVVFHTNIIEKVLTLRAS